MTDIKTLNSLIAEAQNVFVADSVYAYASELVEETRHNAYIQLGISPRGALALCRAAKAFYNSTLTALSDGSYRLTCGGV